MKTIAVVIPKGGAGKTVSAINIAYALQRNNKKVLLIDTDPSCSIETYFNIENENNLHELIKEQYENLLKKYNFGVDDIDYQQARNCIENCLYIKPKNDRVSGVYTIIGNESYIAKRNRENRKKIDEINKKYAK